MYRGKDGSHEQAAMSGQEACGVTTDGDGRDSDRRAGKKPIAMERDRDHPGPDSDRAHEQDSWPEPAYGRNGAEGATGLKSL